MAKLNFVKSEDYLPTVEVNCASFDEATMRMDEAICAWLRETSEKKPTLTATVYTYCTYSTSFGFPTQSMFIGVAGPSGLAGSLQNFMRQIPNVESRMGELIERKKSRPGYHVQDSTVWTPLEGDTWIQHEFEDQHVSEELVGSEVDEDDFENSEGVNISSEEPLRRSSTLKQRKRVARGDALLGTIGKKIEEMFGLPEDSVRFVDPKGNILRKDALVSTLRKRWDE